MNCTIQDIDYELEKRFHLTTDDLFDPWDAPKLIGEFQTMPLELAIKTIIQMYKLEE